MKKAKKPEILDLKPTSQGVCKLAIDSRVGPKVHGTQIYVIQSSFGPSRTSVVVTKEENRVEFGLKIRFLRDLAIVTWL